MDICSRLILPRVIVVALEASVEELMMKYVFPAQIHELHEAILATGMMIIKRQSSCVGDRVMCTVGV